MKKKVIALLLAAGLAAGSFAGCSSEENNADTTAESNQETESEDTTPSEEPAEETDGGEIIQNLYNPDFSIEKLEDGIKRVIDGEGRELILVPKELEEVPEEYAGSIVIRTPVDNAVFLSSTQVCTFRTVDDEAIISAIAGVSGGADEWADIPAIQKGMESGDIVDVGGGMGEPDYELIQSMNPEIVFVYTGSSPQTNQIAKFEELGINYAVDNEYMESNYLARMEWMRFVLTFFNADDEVDAVMKTAQENVDAAKEKIGGLEEPEVAIFSVSDGTVYATSDDSWVGSMIEDMGGVNAFSGLPDGAVTLEAAYEAVQDSDVIIYTSTPSYCTGMADIQEAFPQITDCEAYANDRVYQYGSTFWHGIDQSDIMASDLAAVLYPDQFADRDLTYFLKVNK